MGPLEILHAAKNKSSSLGKTSHFSACGVENARITPRFTPEAQLASQRFHGPNASYTRNHGAIRGELSLKVAFRVGHRCFGQPLPGSLLLRHQRQSLRPGRVRMCRSERLFAAPLRSQLPGNPNYCATTVSPGCPAIGKSYNPAHASTSRRFDMRWIVCNRFSRNAHIRKVADTRRIGLWL